MIALVGSGPPAWVAAMLWAASQVFVLTEMLRPRSVLFGPNLWRAAGQPRVALTFDDGPHPEDTPAILEILRAAGARATFFFVGERIRAHPELARRAAREGHGVEVHSDTHPWWFSLAWPGRVRREVHDAIKTLQVETGCKPRFFRPPMGHKHILLRSELDAAGVRMATWSVRPFDTVRRSPQRIRDAVVERATGGGIILLHEGVRRRAGNSSPTVAALAGIIEGLRARGLEPVSLEDLREGPATEPGFSRPASSSGVGASKA